MEPLREYILSVVAAAILCAVISSLVKKKGSAWKILRMLGGMILALTVIRPAAAVKIEEFLTYTENLQGEALDAAAVGNTLYQDSLTQVITEQTRAYILDKAQTLNAAVTVEVTLNEQAIPWEVTISGSLSPYAKNMLEQSISSDLGIPKERQRWIG